MKNIYNRLHPTYDSRDFRFEPQITAFPSVFDTRAKQPPIYDQGQRWHMKSRRMRAASLSHVENLARVTPLQLPIKRLFFIYGVSASYLY